MHGILVVAGFLAMLFSPCFVAVSVQMRTDEPEASDGPDS